MSRLVTQYRWQTMELSNLWIIINLQNIRERDWTAIIEIRVEYLQGRDLALPGINVYRSADGDEALSFHLCKVIRLYPSNDDNPLGKNKILSTWILMRDGTGKRFHLITGSAYSILFYNKQQQNWQIGNFDKLARGSWYEFTTTKLVRMFKRQGIE